MKRLWIGLAVLVLVGLPLLAQQAPTVAVFISTLKNPYFVTLAEGARAAGKALGAQVVIYDGQDDAALQLSQVEDAIAAGVQAICINPAHTEALIPAVERANEVGVPVFSVDRDVLGGQRVCYIGTSNVLAAEQGAATFIRFLALAKRPLPWRIVILEGIPGASAAVEREQGFKNVLNPLIEGGAVEIVADLTAQFDRAEGYRVMSDILATTTDIDGVIAANDEMILGALEAIKAAGVPVGFPGGIILMGFDAIDDAVAAVRTGELVGTVAQAPYIQGYWGVEAAYRYLVEGWRPPEGTQVYEPTGALFIPTPVAVVTAENVDQVAQITKSPPPLPGTE
ncbi:MAG TPA: D-ribose ABC transporter substrate-binding protein [Candidatus Acetothermia bacterium]|nr:D-ribose ABC transporter substrate-binding protein [Candidatus Acetothermia bacterium]